MIVSNPITGTLLHAVGGVSAASCFLPNTRTKQWSWGSFWLVFSLFAWLIVPIIIGYLTVPNLFNVLAEAPSKAFWMCFLLGAAYGFGGMAFGKAIIHIGYSLTYTLSIGISAVLGTIFPMLIFGQLGEYFAKPGGYIVLTGMIFSMIGVFFCGWAGFKKEKYLKSLSGEQPHFNMKTGLFLTVVAGVLSGIFNLALEYGQPIADIAAKNGAGQFEGNSKMIIATSGCWIVNLIWFIIEGLRNKTLKELFPSKGNGLSGAKLTKNWLWSIFAGCLWYFQFFFYGLGHVKMGNFQFISWVLHMSMLIFFSFIVGLLMKEWKKVSKNAYIRLVIGLIILVSSFCIMSYGSYKGEQAVTENITEAGNAFNTENKMFDSSWESLEHYECPEWFRDAKFGIYSHWNAQSVPGQGGWYARDMYIQGSSDYKYHIANYGHPSKVGYKDVIEMWKAENFDADNIISIYKEAGAKYFVAVAVHHDNFDLWDSKHHEWNAVNHGPHQNIIGKWEAATRKAGLRWGVTSHAERSWNWIAVSHGADKDGQYAGVPYDGADPKYAGLYFKEYPGYKDTRYDYAVDPPQEVIEDYVLRIKDLIDQHNPDFFYNDGGIPFGETGRKMIAYYYNQNMRRNNGKLEAVMCLKNYASSYHGDDLRDGIATENVEDGQLDRINGLPWQTDESVADWFYKKHVTYKKPNYIIDKLIDIVSKNGNLMLNVPPRPDGTLDDEAVEILREIGKWLKVNGEGIYGTRPYSICGEGPTKVTRGYFRAMPELTGEDFRFTTKGDTVYAFICDPDVKTISIETFSSKRYHGVLSVGLLGGDRQLSFFQTDEALTVVLPDVKPCKYALCLRIIPDINPVPETVKNFETLAGVNAFGSDWNSLEKYRCPDWFRNAKFGIWTCWNPYTVPAAGDWYARNMYEEGSRQYKYHLEHYGHPSEVGYKDIVEMWKGENFDPESMVSLFKEAGARYIVAMAAHHDNFDLWDSKHHEWNSVNHGPHQNIIGKWETAVRKSGLKWGVTSHLERAWNWMALSHGADKEGKYAGVPYDGADPKYAGLYFPEYEGYKDTHFQYAVNPPDEVVVDYMHRIKDLLDQHNPDFFYIDGGIPFGETGRKMLAYYYNSNIKRSNGRLEATMCAKNYGDGFHGDDLRDGVATQDVERGQLDRINDLPWQTDDSVGDWFWTQGDHYNSPKYIIDQLIDIVSKNGNLLLNVPPRADGTLDDQAVTLLKEIGKWLKVNGEGIYGTRPYSVFGEGPTQVSSGYFVRMAELTAKDLRFTTKGDTIFTFVCGTSAKTVSIKALSGNNYHKIKSISMLGVDGELSFKQTQDALEITLPASKPSDYAVCLKIIPILNPVPPSLPIP